MNFSLDRIRQFPTENDYDTAENYSHMGTQLEGWIMVCEGDPPPYQPLIPSVDHSRYAPWHPAFCVLRPDEMSLVGYRREFYGIAPPNLLRIRMDGGRSAFASYWKIPYTHVYSINFLPPERVSIAGGYHTISRCQRQNRLLPEAMLMTDEIPTGGRFETMSTDYGSSNSLPKAEKRVSFKECVPRSYSPDSAANITNNGSANRTRDVLCGMSGGRTTGFTRSAIGKAALQPRSESLARRLTEAKRRPSQISQRGGQLQSLVEIDVPSQLDDRFEGLARRIAEAKRRPSQRLAKHLQALAELELLPAQEDRHHQPPPSPEMRNSMRPRHLRTLPANHIKLAENYSRPMLDQLMTPSVPRHRTLHHYGTSRDQIRDARAQRETREAVVAGAPIPVRRRAGTVDAAPAIRKRLSRSCDHLAEIGLSPRLPPIRRRPTRHNNNNSNNSNMFAAQSTQHIIREFFS